jgi:hypothetical protein
VVAAGTPEAVVEEPAACVGGAMDEDLAAAAVAAANASGLWPGVVLDDGIFEALVQGLETRA